MNKSPQYRFAFIAVSILFFMWGFITVMNDILINSFSDLFKLKPTELSYIQLSFFGSFFFISLLYFIVSSVTGKDPINKIGYKNGMSISLLIAAMGCSAFYISAQNASYPQFILSLFILSTGITLLQICANPYVAILGEERSASSRLNLAQGLNSLGTTIGPIVGNILIYNVFSNGEKSVESVGTTYLLYGFIFLILAIFIGLNKLPAFTNNTVNSSGLQVLKNRNLRFGILAIFFYVGSEVAVGSWLGSFSKDPSIMGLNEQSANYYLAFFWGGLMIGRLMASISLSDKWKNERKWLPMLLTSVFMFFIIWIATGIKVDTGNNGTLLSFDPISLDQLWIYNLFMLLNFFAFLIGKGKAERLIVIFCSINAILLVFGIFSSGAIAFWSILGTGLFFSIGWSNIFSLSIKGLGNMTSQGSSLLVMAIVGGAIIPYVQSQIIEISTIQTSFLVPLLAMIYLIFFGISGYKQNTTDTSSPKSS